MSYLKENEILINAKQESDLPNTTRTFKGIVFGDENTNEFSPIIQLFDLLNMKEYEGLIVEEPFNFMSTSLGGYMEVPVPLEKKNELLLKVIAILEETPKYEIKHITEYGYVKKAGTPIAGEEAGEDTFVPVGKYEMVGLDITKHKIHEVFMKVFKHLTGLVYKSGGKYNQVKLLFNHLPLFLGQELSMISYMQYYSETRDQMRIAMQAYINISTKVGNLPIEYLDMLILLTFHNPTDEEIAMPMKNRIIYYLLFLAKTKQSSINLVNPLLDIGEHKWIDMLSGNFNTAFNNVASIQWPGEEAIQKLKTLQL